MAKKLMTDLTVSFLRKSMTHVLGWLCFLVSVSFLTLTYDSAHVKLTLFQIGASLLLVLWGALKIAERKNPFTRKHILLLLPFLIYGAWQLVSFSLFPYKWDCVEETLRMVLYGGILALVTCEFTLEDVRTIIKFIIAAAWVSFVYGVVQTLAIWWPSIDIMPWHGFFVKRVFSTHANPNFFGDFVVFTSCLIGAQYILTRKKNLVVLLVLRLTGLVFSETKGAWIAYGAAGVCFAGLFTNFFAKFSAAKKRFINVAAVGVMLLALAVSGFYATKRFQSVSFRAHTWLAAFEMVKDSPLMGTGPGSFKVVYPAYRHPQIFYIENAHNTETQHAENEYLEQWVVGGTIGLVLFLWLIVFLGRCAYKQLKEPEKKSNQTHEKRVYVLGISAGIFGMLVHMLVDISVHFVSSGLLGIVLAGLLLALNADNEPAHVPEEGVCVCPAFLRMLKIIVGGLFILTSGYLTVKFYQMMHVLVARNLGETLLILIAWLGWIFCVGGVLYVCLKSLFLTKRPLVAGILSVFIVPSLVFFGFFAANHYYSVGVTLTRLNEYDAALAFFTKAIKHNPIQTEYLRYRGNVFATVLNLTSLFSKERGDTKAPSNDYERALKDFSTVLKRVPNHALIHQDIAQLYYKMAVRYLERAQTAKDPMEFYLFEQLAAENMVQAKIALERALQLDPVNENTYILRISIALMARDFDTASEWINAYRRGPEGVTEPEFLARHRSNPRIEMQAKQLEQLRARGTQN